MLLSQWCVDGVNCAVRGADLTLQYELTMQFRINERVVNGELAKILADFASLRVVSEGTRRGTGGNAPDLLIIPHPSQSRSVAIEAKVGTSTTQQNAALADAQQRLANFPNVYAAIALCYPDDIANANDNVQMAETLYDAKNLEFVEVTEDGPVGQWQKGSWQALATAVIYAGEGIAQNVVATINDSIEEAMVSLSDVSRERIAQALDLPGKRLIVAGRPATDEDGNPIYDYTNPAKIGCLLMLNGIMMQSRLIDAGVFSKYGVRIESPEACMQREAPQLAFIENWQSIRKIDYHPIYNAALQTLLSLTDHWSVKQLLGALYKGAAGVASNVSDIRSDLAGRIYHRLLNTAPFDGSYYTSTPAAILLARLALPSDFIDWSDPEEIIKLKICDPACGTGTLLMAAAQVCRERHIIANGNGSTDELMHLHMIEDILNGMDINLSAVHLAASMLTLANPKVDFNRMGVYRAKFGMERTGRTNGSKAWLGSLEMLQGNEPRLQFPDFERSGGEGQEDTYPNLHNKCDLVIMNPPFTRDSLRHDQFSREDELEMKRAERRLLDKHPDGKSVHRSTVSTMFNLLADELAKDTSSMFARVMPAAEGTGVSAQPARIHLNEKWQAETIITSHDPRRIYFSENTSITESLLVARRRLPEDGPRSTKFINLAKNPASSFDALGLANDIEEGDLSNWGTVQWNSAEAMSQGDWLPMVFYDPQLTTTARMLRHGMSGTLKPLGEMAQVSPPGQGVREVFRRVSARQSSDMRALWRHESEERVTMRAEPDRMITPKSGKEQTAERYWEQRSNLLLASRLYPLTAATPAVFSNKPIIGSAWIPVTPNNFKIDPAKVMKAWCVWGNSSAGIISFLAISQRKLTYPSFSMDGLRTLPFPDPATCPDAIASLANTYDELRNSRLLSLPNARDCQVRLAIDEAVAQAFTHRLDDIHEWRCLIATEPNVLQKPATNDS